MDTPRKSTPWTAHPLPPGFSLKVWYHHPNNPPALVIVTGLKHQTSPDVEWINPEQRPKEFTENDLIFADDLPGHFTPADNE